MRPGIGRRALGLGCRGPRLVALDVRPRPELALDRTRVGPPLGVAPRAGIGWLAGAHRAPPNVQSPYRDSVHHAARPVATGLRGCARPKRRDCIPKRQESSRRGSASSVVRAICMASGEGLGLGGLAWVARELEACNYRCWSEGALVELASNEYTRTCVGATDARRFWGQQGRNSINHGSGTS